VAFELFTGQAPYGRDLPMAVLLAHVSEPPPSAAARRPGMPVAADRVMAQGAGQAAGAAVRVLPGLHRCAAGGVGPVALRLWRPPISPGASAREPASPLWGQARPWGGLAARPHAAGLSPAFSVWARPHDGEPTRHPRRRPCDRAGGAVLVAAVAIPWLLASSPGAPAAKAPARTQPTTLARLSAALSAPPGSHSVESAAFKPGTATLAVGMFNGDVDLWDTTTKNIINILHEPGKETTGVGSVAFGPGGTPGRRRRRQRLPVGHRGPDRQPHRHPPAPSMRPGKALTSLASGPGDTLAVGYSEADVYLWDSASKQTTATSPAPPTA